MQQAAMFPYWIVIFIVIAAQTRRRIQMGPRLQITPEEFLEIAKNSQNLVIKSGKRWLSGLQYVIREVIIIIIQLAASRWLYLTPARSRK
jgi:hypothetical protein